MKTQTTETPGAIHADLMGAASTFRFRPQRLASQDLTKGLSCTFRHENREVRPLSILDVSPTGLGVRPEADAMLPPGSQLDDLHIIYRDSTLWRGKGVTVYQVGGDSPRLGIRFTTGYFDPYKLRLRDSLVEQQLEDELQHHQRKKDLLPVEWRAEVGDLLHLLYQARNLFEELEQHLRQRAPIRRRRDDKSFIEAAFAKWGPLFFAQVARLFELSRAFDPDTRELAARYATQILFPLLSVCPMHRRSHDKPLGYAGDYLLMTMYFDVELVSGTSMFSKFLQYLSQRYSLGKTVRSRLEMVGTVLREALHGRGARRILSLASGPALELQDLVRTTESLGQRVEMFLIDQDNQALAFCHEALIEELSEKSPHLPLELHCLHYSVRQILKPKDEAELHMSREVLRNMDLLYSVGLFDYLPEPIAQRLLRQLYAMMGSGGEMFIGNLQEAPDTTWVMEYVLAWHLQYRTPETMLELASGMQPPPAQLEVVTDSTGYCLFLRIVKP